MKSCAFLAAALLALAPAGAALAGGGHGKHKKGLAALGNLEAIVGDGKFDNSLEGLLSGVSTGDAPPGLAKVGATSDKLSADADTLAGLLRSAGSAAKIDAAKATVNADIVKLEKQGAGLEQQIEALGSNATPADLAKIQQAYQVLSNELKALHQIQTSIIENTR